MLTDKSTIKRPLGKPKGRLEDNFRMYLKQVSIRGIRLIWLRIVLLENPCECGI